MADNPNTDQDLKLAAALRATADSHQPLIAAMRKLGRDDIADVLEMLVGQITRAAQIQEDCATLLLCSCDWLSDALSRNQIVSEIDRENARAILDASTKLGRNFKELVEKSYPPDFTEHEDDPLLDRALEIVVNEQMASVSMIHRRLRVGYTRAGRIISQLESKGVISGYDGSRPRRVLIQNKDGG